MAAATVSLRIRRCGGTPGRVQEPLLAPLPHAKSSGLGTFSCLRVDPAGNGFLLLVILAGDSELEL
jgi:hypothetical protein